MQLDATRSADVLTSYVNKSVIGYRRKVIKYDATFLNMINIRYANIKNVLKLIKKVYNLNAHLILPNKSIYNDKN